MNIEEAKAKIEEQKHMIEIMQAFVDGEIIEVKDVFSKDIWLEINNPKFDGMAYSYRVKPKTPDYINWDHVHPDYNYMARDAGTE